jgi:hypothetical protein
MVTGKIVRPDMVVAQPVHRRNTVTATRTATARQPSSATARCAVRRLWASRNYRLHPEIRAITERGAKPRYFSLSSCNNMCSTRWALQRSYQQLNRPIHRTGGEQ